MDQADRASKLRNSFKLRLSGFQSCAHHLTTNSFFHACIVTQRAKAQSTTIVL